MINSHSMINNLMMSRLEETKKRSPIWKKEHYQNNETDWLKGNPIQYEKN